MKILCVFITEKDIVFEMACAQNASGKWILGMCGNDEEILSTLSFFLFFGK
jgi:hypothetical protein